MGGVGWGVVWCGVVWCSVPYIYLDPDLYPIVNCNVSSTILVSRLCLIFRGQQT